MYVNAPSIEKYTVSGSSSFPFRFKFYEESDIIVYYVPPNTEPDDEQHALDPADYTIDSQPSMIGGSVNISIAIEDGGTVTIVRNLQITRLIDYATRGSFKADTIDMDQNYQTYLISDMAYYSTFFIKAPISTPIDSPLTMPAPVSEAYIRWNLAGDALINDLEPSTWRTETEGFRNETEGFRNETEAFRNEGESFKDLALTYRDNAFDWSSAPEDQPVDDGTHQGFSAFHWAQKASYAAAGLVYRGAWSVDASGTLPPDDTVNGAFYIVESVDSGYTGELRIGDWLIWSEADDGGDDSWHIINWTFDWSAITNVPVDVSQGFTPVGGIIMYSGAFANIPSNWAVCDGTNGTPDLTDKFIRGTSVEADIGVEGGSDNAVVVSHSHSASSGTDGSHKHNSGVAMRYTGYAVYGEITDDMPGGATNGAYGSTGNEFQAITSTTGDHTHSVTVNSAGEDGTGKNLPSYYQLAYIMRLS